MSLFVYKHEFTEPGCRTCEVHVPAQQAPALAAACLLSRKCGQRSVSIAHPAAPRASQQCVARCVHSNYRGRHHACLWVTADWSRHKTLPTNIPRGCFEGGCAGEEGGCDMGTAEPAICGWQHPVAAKTCPAQTTGCTQPVMSAMKLMHKHVFVLLLQFLPTATPGQQQAAQQELAATTAITAAAGANAHNNPACKHTTPISCLLSSFHLGDPAAAASRAPAVASAPAAGDGRCGSSLVLVLAPAHEPLATLLAYQRSR